MMNNIIYAVAVVVVIEIIREYFLYKKRKRIKNGGKMSKWALERYIDFKKLLILLAIGVIVYFSLPFIKENLIPGIRGMSWLFNRQLLFVFLRIIGIVVLVEIVYKFVLVKFFHKISSFWERAIRYFYWGILIYLVVGLWPFGKIAVEKVKEAINKPYTPRTEKEREDIEKIKEMRGALKGLKETMQKRQSEIDGY